MATQRIDVRRELVSTDAIAFIRPISIRVTATNLKPLTKMYAYFDGIDVNEYFTQDGKAKGEQLVTNANGALSATFDVPGLAFPTGTRELVLLDYDTYIDYDVQGVSIVRAKATFNSRGTLETFQTTETTVTINTIERVVEVNYDPLAQSFFTYGVEGGCFITSIDLYFFTKDSTLPAWIEIREMENGYPSKKFVDDFSNVSLNPSQINVSTDASVATKFTFGRPIYLKQDTEYCFVVRSNSSKYNLWVSKLGESSVENSATIFEQPYMGSLFRSENNVTWTAEQTEDIKFTLYKAEFDTSVSANLQFGMHPNYLSMDTRSFNTFAGETKIIVTFPFKHGLDVNSKIGVKADSDCTYNGVSGTLFTGDFDITDVIDEFNVAYTAPGISPTKTGQIATTGLVHDIVITNGGSGYSQTNPPALVFSSPGSGATGTVKIRDGKITGVTITNKGSGYNENTTITFDSTGTTGSGATAIVVTSSPVLVYINRVYQAIKPTFGYFAPAGSNVSATLQTTQAFYEDGNLTNYSSGAVYDIDLDTFNDLNNNLLAASKINETLVMGGNNSAMLSTVFSSSNKNVSPFIDLTRTKATLRNYSINNQKSESILSTNSSGSIQNVVLIQGGSGYTIAPTVVFSGTGTGATATASISGGVVTGVVVNTGGSGYYGEVKVYLVEGSETTTATATAVVSDYNSELSRNNGRAQTRYIQKIQSVEQPSKSIKLYANAFSNASSSFEVYIRTALSFSGETITDKEWTLLDCPVGRNRSRRKNEFFDYEFSAENIDVFDSYQLKFVLRTSTPWEPPSIRNYRAIILA